MAARFIICFLLFLGFSAQAEIQVFKVERLVSPRSDSYGDNTLGLAPQLAQIEIGADTLNKKKISLPNREDFKQIILVGTKGVTNNTTFYEFEKRCEFLCGDELEECHNTALLGWQSDDIGVPLLVITKLSDEIEHFVSYIDTAATTEKQNISIHEQALTWPAHNFLSIDIKGDEGEFNLRYEKDNSYSYSVKGKECRWYSYQGTKLTRLSCGGAEVLLEEYTPLLFSDADYNIPHVQVINRFNIDGQTYYTVELALKAYTAYGLLTKEQGKWHFIVKPANWASLC